MNQAQKLLKNLVSIPSVSAHEQEAVNYLIKEARQLNFDEVKKDGAGNFIARRGSGEITILLVGHIDTVPGDIPVVIKAGNLYGRGSVDAKGCLATFIWATHEAKVPEDLTVVVIGCVEEEIYTSHGARHVLGKYNPDYIIIGEPSSWDRITIGYKGGLRFVFSQAIEMEHFSARKVSAADGGVDFIIAVRKELIKFQPENGGIFYQPNFEVRSFNTSSDGLQEKVKVTCNLRIPPEFDIDKFKKFLDQYAVEISEDIAPVIANKNNNLVRAFLASIRSIEGDPRFVKKTGSSDMNILASHWSHIPILAYGPGDSKLDHTPNEHLNLTEYEKAIRVLETVLNTL
jgi:[amino group carrier protein]-lysine/ornithine hydrolase